MFHLAGQPRRLPFTDWAARVERIIASATGEVVRLDRSSRALRGCYDVGLSPHDIAEDWTTYHK